MPEQRWIFQLAGGLLSKTDLEPLARQMQNKYSVLA